MAKQAENNSPMVTLGIVAILGFVGIKYVLPMLKLPGQLKHYIPRLIVNMRSLKISKDAITFNLAIQNPNTSPLKISAVTGKVYVNYGKSNALEIGQVAHYGMDVIEPVRQSFINIIVKLNKVNSVFYFLQTLLKQSNQVMTFDGNITLALGDSQQIPIPIRQSLKVA